MRHDEIFQMLGAYVLGAVDQHEKAGVDIHLGDCPECRAESDELAIVASVLSARGTEPSPAVWDRIRSQLPDQEWPPARRREPSAT